MVFFLMIFWTCVIRWDFHFHFWFYSCLFPLQWVLLLGCPFYLFFNESGFILLVIILYFCFTHLYSDLCYKFSSTYVLVCFCVSGFFRDKFNRFFGLFSCSLVALYSYTVFSFNCLNILNFLRLFFHLCESQGRFSFLFVFLFDLLIL